MEIWKKIDFYDGRYSVSTCGRVRNDKTGLFLKPRKDRWGYFQLGLSQRQTQKMFKVHRLVMLTFNPIDNPEKYHVDHIDFNPANNDISNLAWSEPHVNVIVTSKIRKSLKSIHVYKKLLSIYGDEDLYILLSSYKEGQPKAAPI